LRKGKYHNYKLSLLEYLVDNNFLIKIGKEHPEQHQLASKLGIPLSSWYDITRDLYNSELILMKYKGRPISGIVVTMAYEMQLTKKGLEFLTRFRHT